MQRILFIYLLLFYSISQLSAQTEVEIINESGINSEELEFSPTYHDQGIVFVSSRKSESQSEKNIDKKINKNFMTLYYAERNADNQLVSPEEFSYQLTTNYHEGPVSFSSNSQQIFFTRNDYNKGKKKVNKRGIIKLNIYTALRAGDDWGEAIELPFNTSEYEECHPSLSEDGKMLFFASDREGGYGGMDIYMVLTDGEKWSVPFNLGPNINTAKNEIFPFIHNSGKLYFASEGREGLGGLDIFTSTKNQLNEWSIAQNIGAPLNSDGDDFGIIVNSESNKGYFSSSRADAKGGDDIYSFSMPGGLDPSINASICTKMQNSDTRISDVEITILEQVSQKEVLSLDGNDVNLVPSNSEGEYTLNIRQQGNGNSPLITDEQGTIQQYLKANRKYLIVASKNGLRVSEQKLSTEGMTATDVINICLDMVEERSMSITGLISNKQVGNRLSGSVVTLTNHCTNEIQTAKSNILGEFSFSDIDCSCEFTISGAKENYLDATSRVKINDEYCVNGGVQKFVLKLDPIQGQLAANNSINNQTQQHTNNSHSHQNSNHGYNSYNNTAYAHNTYDSGIHSNTDLREGITIELENIYYDFDKYRIKEEAIYTLNDVVNLMRQYPNMYIELSAHTDSRGNTKYNQRLSQKRANKAVEYIQSKGIASERLLAVGYGEKELRNICADGVDCTEEQHLYNRRTQITITKFDRSDIRIKYVNNSPDLGKRE